MQIAAAAGAGFFAGAVGFLAMAGIYSPMPTKAGQPQNSSAMQTSQIQTGQIQTGQAKDTGAATMAFARREHRVDRRRFDTRYRDSSRPRYRRSYYKRRYDYSARRRNYRDDRARPWDDRSYQRRRYRTRRYNRYARYGDRRYNRNRDAYYKGNYPQYRDRSDRSQYRRIRYKRSWRDKYRYDRRYARFDSDGGEGKDETGKAKLKPGRAVETIHQPQKRLETMQKPATEQQIPVSEPDQKKAETAPSTKRIGEAPKGSADET